MTFIFNLIHHTVKKNSLEECTGEKTGFYVVCFFFDIVKNSRYEYFSTLGTVKTERLKQEVSLAATTHTATNNCLSAVQNRERPRQNILDFCWQIQC